MRHRSSAHGHVVGVKEPAWYRTASCSIRMVVRAESWIVPSFMIARNVYGEDTWICTGSPTLFAEVPDGNDMFTVGLRAPGRRWHAMYR